MTVYWILDNEITNEENNLIIKQEPGDMLIIDNRSSMHKAGFDYDHSQHRMLYRALVRGDKPF